MFFEWYGNENAHTTWLKAHLYIRNGFLYGVENFIFGMRNKMRLVLFIGLSTWPKKRMIKKEYRSDLLIKVLAVPRTHVHTFNENFVLRKFMIPYKLARNWKKETLTQPSPPFDYCQKKNPFRLDFYAYAYVIVLLVLVYLTFLYYTDANSIYLI